MARHLTSDAHEWINEIPAVPTLKVRLCKAGLTAQGTQRFL